MLKFILVALLILLVGSVSASAQCDLTSGYTNVVTITEGVIETTFATDGTSYGLGATVNFELIAKNVGAESASLTWQTNPPEWFLVTPPDCTDIYDYDCNVGAVFGWPEIIFYYPSTVILESGECLRYNVAWDLAADPAPTGTYKAWGGIHEVNVDTWPNPPGFWLYPSMGATLMIDLTDVVAVEPVVWGQVKSLYR